MPDKNFGELISNFTFISRGKSKFLDCLYLIRQGHNERYLMKSGTNWVKSPNWNRSLQICIKSLSSIISKEDQISYKTANYIVNKVFDDIIVRSIKKGDKIITMGGIYGTVQGIKDKNRKIVVKVDNNTNITINTTAVAGLAENVKGEELEQA